MIIADQAVALNTLFTPTLVGSATAMPGTYWTLTIRCPQGQADEQSCRETV
jgi:hypothetical protein